MVLILKQATVATEAATASPVNAPCYTAGYYLSTGSNVIFVSAKLKLEGTEPTFLLLA